MSGPNASLSDAYQPHDHQHCIDTALLTARQLCQDRGVKLTHIREQVLTLILQDHRPIGAYSILGSLALPDGRERKPAPPTVYRALEFLINQQLIHRIASLNAYIACCRPARTHQGQFLICQHCQRVQELNCEIISEAISARADLEGFEVKRECIEISGCCPNCKGSNQERALELPRQES